MTECYLIYDDTCSICQSSVSLVRRLDRLGLVQLVPLSNPRLPTHLLLPDQRKLQQEIHLVKTSGELFVGADGLAELTRALPRLSWLGWFLSLPVIRPVARRMYRWFADRRPRTHLPPGDDRLQ